VGSSNPRPKLKGSKLLLSLAASVLVGQHLVEQAKGAKEDGLSARVPLSLISIVDDAKVFLASSLPGNHEFSPAHPRS